jgi:biopolymer transport protein ExbD
MNFGRTGRKHEFSMDMTPMIDMVLQLIIFFMFTSQFAQLIKSPIDLPKESGQLLAEEQAAQLVVDVAANGTYLVEAKPVELEAVVQLVSREVQRHGGRAEAVRLLVRADQSAPSLHINVLAEALTQLGVRHWQLGTSGPSSILRGGGGT